MQCCTWQPVCTTYWHTCVCVSAPCAGSAFFCHSNMCINTSLVCNGIQNCVFPWDESNCKGTPVVLKYFYNDACRVRLCCVTLSLLEEVFCVVFLPDTTEQSILNSGQMLDGTEYSFKRNSWQENNYLIIFTAFAAKRPSKPFGCLVAL